MRAAAALEVGGLCGAADHGQVDVGLERQNAVVLKQHDTLAGDLRHRVMRVHVERTTFGRLGRLKDDAQNTARCFVENRLVQVAVMHGVDHGLGAPGPWSGHFKIQPGLECGHTLVDGAPVRNDQPVRPHSSLRMRVSRS